MPETPNHNYNVPEKGQDDWATPLNENFRQYDTDIEIRDLDANKSDYEPKDGAKFLATDTGNVYLGDGSSWTELSMGESGAESKGKIFQQRSQPTTGELTDGEVMTYSSDGSDGHIAGDLVYAINDNNTIKTQVIVAKNDVSDWDFYEDFEQYSIGQTIDGVDGWTVTNDSDDTANATEIESAFSGLEGEKALGTAGDGGFFEIGIRNTQVTSWRYPDSGFTFKALLSNGGGSDPQPNAQVYAVPDSVDGGSAGIEIDTFNDNITFNDLDNNNHVLRDSVDKNTYEVEIVGTTDQNVTGKVRGINESNWTSQVVAVDFTGSIKGVKFWTNNGGQADKIRLRQD